MKVFGIEVTPSNKRKAHCADCKIVLEIGEGIGHRYPMFHGGGEFYYLCVDCHQKRTAADDLGAENRMQHG